MNKTDIMIGSMLWVVPDESDEQMEKDIRGMLDNGLIIARIFMNTNFSLWDRFFAACERLGMKLTVTLISLNVPRASKYMTTDEALCQYDESRKRVLQTIEATVERYKNSPAVHSWILQNEPNLYIDVDAATLPLFRRWLLQERYQYDLEALKAAHLYGNTAAKIQPRDLTDEEKAAIEREYAPISENIGQVQKDGSGFLRGIGNRSWGYVQRIDWAFFNAWLMSSQLHEANRLVKQLDPNHPTTINPAGVATEMPVNGGQHLYWEGKTVDFLGCSCHVSWHSHRFGADKVHQSVAMFCDEMRSATMDPDGYFWITELQAGTNYFSGIRPMSPKSADITHWLWEAIGTGCKGMIYWLYSPRPSGFEGLEWGLLNQQGGPSRRSRASKAIADVIYKNQALFAPTKPRKYDGYLLHSYDSMVLSYSERMDGPRTFDLSDPRNAFIVRDALCGAYQMAQDAGYDVGFINEHELEGRLQDIPFVIAPNTYGLSPSVIKQLRDYVEQGGTLIVDGLFGAKDHYGKRSSEEAQQAVRDIFSDTVTDWGVDLQTFSFTRDEGEPIPGWFLYCNWEKEDNLKVLARDEEGYASIIEHSMGKGRAVYIGTHFFQNYFAQNGVAGYADMLRSLLPAPRRDYRLDNVSPFLRMKVLEGEEWDIVILLNRGDATDALLSSDCAGTWEDLYTGEEIALKDHTAVPMEKMQVRVFVYRK